MWLTRTGIRVAKDGLEKAGDEPRVIKDFQVGVTEFVRYFRGISYEDFIRMSGESGVTETALTNFFKVLKAEPITLSDDLDHIFRKNAELMTLLMLVQAAKDRGEPDEREKASSHARDIKSEIFSGWKTVFTAVISITSYKVGEQVLAPLKDMIRSDIRPAFTGVYTLRSYPATLSERNVRDMIRKYNFYCKKHDWTKNWHNESGNFRNDFFDNRDGTVTDNATGLMWQQSGSDDSLVDYKKAQTYVRELNQRRFAGHGDWRLPTLEELMSLMENRKTNGLYIDSVFDRKQPWCLSSDKWKWSWSVNFSYSDVSWNVIGTYVRAVRSR